MHAFLSRATVLAVATLAASAALAQQNPPSAPAAPAAPALDTDVLRSLQQQIDELKAWKEARELEDLRQAAAAAARQEGPQGDTGPRVFQGGERALQALNPELSITGDIYAQYVNRDGKEYARALTRSGADYVGATRSGIFFRGVGLHLQANLDPFSFFKVAVSMSPEGFSFGEAYITWTSVLPRVNLTAGRFRQQLGVVNRWHKHALDQFDFPLMLQEPFGAGGLNQTGVALDVLLPPLWAHEETVTLQVTNGENARAFSGSFFSIPTFLLRLRNYWDLNRDTYLDLGLTGVLGFNHGRGRTATAAVMDVYDSTGKKIEFYDKDGNPVQVTAKPAATPADQALRYTAFGGADLTLSWEPANRSHYAGVTWRTEFLYGYKEVLNKAPIHWMGGYTSLDVKVWQGWMLGIQGDLTQPFDTDNQGHYLWQVAPYVNYKPSEFVRLHLEYDLLDGDLRPRDHRVLLQVVFAAGPHKHDRY